MCVPRHGAIITLSFILVPLVINHRRRSTEPTLQPVSCYKEFCSSKIPVSVRARVCRHAHVVGSLMASARARRGSTTVVRPELYRLGTFQVNIRIHSTKRPVVMDGSKDWPSRHTRSFCTHTFRVPSQRSPARTPAWFLVLSCFLVLGTSDSPSTALSVTSFNKKFIGQNPSRRPSKFLNGT